MPICPDSDDALSRIKHHAQTLCIMAGQSPNKRVPNYGAKPGTYQLWELYLDQAREDLRERKKDQIRFR